MSYRWVVALSKMTLKEYWNKPNAVEFSAFIIKAIIIIPGLLFDTTVWWLYVASLVSSVMLIWSSTEKTLPTLIWFNILWVFLSIAAIAKHFMLT